MELCERKHSNLHDHGQPLQLNRKQVRHMQHQNVVATRKPHGMCMAMKSVKRDDDARFHLDSSKPKGPSEPWARGALPLTPTTVC